MLRALVLGAVQGLTEFVPVSSSGHLVLVPYVLGWGTALGSDLAFDVAVHLGTALAVVLYFWRDLWAIVRGVVRVAAGRAGDDDRAFARLALLLLIGSVPAAGVGVGLEEPVERVFENPPVVAGLLLATTLLLLVADREYRRRSPERRGMVGVRASDSLVIGTLQALAVLPGISRSGATIAAGVGRGLTREAAARFSFLLGLPALVGAGAVALPDMSRAIPLSWVVGAALVAAVTGVAAIALLLRYVRRRPLLPFAGYCALASAVGLGVWLVR